METKVLKSWKDFEIELTNLEHYRDSLINSCNHPDVWVFRGQQDSDFHLDTTLERNTLRECSMRKYLEMMKKAEREIKAFEINTIPWITLDAPAYADWFENKNYLYINGLLAYMIYLRHYGFPSPLLDWTYSSDVAAYFAFQDISSTVKSVAIFAFLDNTSGGKGARLAEPRISRVRYDNFLVERHKAQKSTYTYCSIEREQEVYYCSHENVFSENRRHKFPQDLLWKFVIPVSERDVVIKKLESRGINKSALFGSEVVQGEIEFRELFKKLYRC